MQLKFYLRKSVNVIIHNPLNNSKADNFSVVFHKFANHVPFNSLDLITVSFNVISVNFNKIHRKEFFFSFDLKFFETKQKQRKKNTLKKKCHLFMLLLR